MSYVVSDACIKCKYTDCVRVCPVDCFYEGGNSVVINPDQCIHCGACEPECPVSAISDEDNLPEGGKVHAELNALFSGAKGPGEVNRAQLPQAVLAILDAGMLKPWPNISAKRAPLQNASLEGQRTGKLEEFDPLPPQAVQTG